MSEMTRPFWAIKYGNDAKFKGYNRLTVRGYIGVGWSYTGDITQLRTIDAIKDVLRETMPEERLSNLSHDAPILNAFINEVYENDFVACHDQEDGYIYIGQFKGQCIHDTSLHNCLHLLRKVEWMTPVPLGLVPGAIKTLTNRGTFWRVSEPAELVKAYQSYGKYKMRVDTAGR